MKSKDQETVYDTMDCKQVRDLKEAGIPLSEQGQRILNNSQSFDELGRAIFLDRYSLKAKRDGITKGDLVIAITREDKKYPKKDLGIVIRINEDETVDMHMITGEFEGKTFTQKLFILDKPLEGIRDAFMRVARAVASVETTPRMREQAYEQFMYHFDHKHIQPAGRIMTGASTDDDGNYLSNLTLYNCYVIPSPKDARESIINETLYQMTEIMSRGGGVGINLSSLRPRYAYVRGVHGKSSGAVSWGGLYSFTTGLIEQGGSRRGALMLMIGDWHPDVLEFIESKTQKGMIENANISVLISDAFMEAVKKDTDWNLEFPDYEHASMKDVYDADWDGNMRAWKANGLPTKVYKTIRARDLWNKLVASAWASAEPGMVFIDRYNDMSNSWYFNPIICTNPCGEQGLPGWGVCNLGHLYLASFCKEVSEDDVGPIYEIDWDELRKSARSLTRFLDNVIDLTPYHFPENEKNQKSERRVGGGTLGLGELLIKMRVRYGSDESLTLIDKIYKTIAEEMYSQSSDLAKEKGAFSMFDADKFLQSGFMQQMSDQIREKVRKQGIRNVTLTTQAPTGTVGTMLGTSTGMEPYYAFEYYRQSRLGFYKVLIPLAQQYGDDPKNLPEFFVGAMDLTPEEHVKVQAAVQKWTDSSISKTANVPASFTVDDTKVLYENAYDWGCKGVTIYRDGSRSEQILSTDEKTEQKNLGIDEKAETPAEQKRSVQVAIAQEQTRPAMPLKRDIGSHAVDSAYYEIATGYGTLHVNIVFDDIGPMKMFANLSPIGTEISGLTSAISIMISKYLQQGGDPIKLLKHLNSIKGDKPFGFGQKRVDSIPHALSKVLRDHLIRTGKLQDYTQQSTLDLVSSSKESGKVKEVKPQMDKPKQSAPQLEGLYCPQCYSRNVAMMAGCSEPTCFDCGYSKCG